MPAPTTRPRLTWSTTGAASVTVIGPRVNATSASGDVSICPNLDPPWSTCSPPVGDYTYTLTARDAAGAVVATRATTLTVT
jgi:hypothetical protein